MVKSDRFVHAHLLEPSQAHCSSLGARVEALETEHQGGALLDQQHPPSQQIPNRPQLRVVDVSGGQDVQPFQLRQKECVVLVIGVLDAAVLIDLGRVG